MSSMLLRLSFLCTILLITGCGSAPLVDQSTDQHPLDRFEERNDDPLAAARFFSGIAANASTIKSIFL